MINYSLGTKLLSKTLFGDNQRCLQLKKLFINVILFF